MKRLVAIALAVAAAGCGETTIDSGRLERDIAADAEREGLVLDAVECPAPEVEEGDTFECTVTVKGERRPLEVVQRGDEAVGYDLTPLLEFETGSDAGGDEAAVRFVIDAVNRDPTALCDYATRGYRRRLERQAEGRGCPSVARERYRRSLRDYAVVTSGDTATAQVHPDGPTITLKRQRDGSWLIARVAG